MNEQNPDFIEPETTTDKILKNRYIEKQLKRPMKEVSDEFGLSSELLKNEDLPAFRDYDVPIDKDAIKANLNPAELSAIRINAIQSVDLAFYGNLLGLDLTATQLTHTHYVSILANTSRGKGGWAGYLSKTSKSVSETSLVEKAREIQGSSEKRGLLNKLRGGN